MICSTLRRAAWAAAEHIDLMFAPAPYGYSYNPLRNPLALPWILGGMAIGAVATVGVVLWRREARAAELVAKLPKVPLPTGPTPGQVVPDQIPLVRTSVVLGGTPPFLRNAFQLLAPSSSVVSLSGDGMALSVKVPVDVLVSFPAGPNQPIQVDVPPDVELLQGAVPAGAQVPRDYVLRFTKPMPADRPPVLFEVSKGPGQGEYLGGTDFLRIYAV